MFELGFWVGFLAGSMGVIGTLSQLVKMIKSKDTTGVSYLWLAWLLASMVLWSSYGIYLLDPIIMGFNLFFTGSFVSMIAYKYRCERRKI